MAMTLSGEQQAFFFKISKQFLVVAPNTKPKTYWLTVNAKRTPYVLNQDVLLRLRTLVRDSATIPDGQAFFQTARLVCFLVGHLSRDLEEAQAARALQSAIEAAFPAMA